MRQQLIKVDALVSDYYITGAGCTVRYVRRPFTHEPDFGVTSVNYGWRELWNRGEEPT